MGVGEAKTDAKLLDAAIEELTIIAGQRAQVRRARKSVAQFKIREGMPIGARVTLRGDRMWEFLDRLVSIALPRIRDFRGLNPDSFDGRGNYSLGLREQIIFPEIDYDSIKEIRGLDVAITTTCKDGRAGEALLRGLGLPLATRSAKGVIDGQEISDRKAARPAKYKVRNYTRCNKCGRPRAVYKKFGLCRICLRELAHQGVIPGMTKSSLVGAKSADRSRRRHAHPHPQRQQGAARSREMPSSKLKVEIARILKEEGYIRDFRVDEDEALTSRAHHRAQVRAQPRARALRASSASPSRAAASTRGRTACRACSAAWAPRSCPPHAA